MYLDHYKTEKKGLAKEAFALKNKKLEKIKENILSGIAYYKLLFEKEDCFFNNDKPLIMDELESIELELITQ